MFLSKKGLNLKTFKYLQIKPFFLKFEGNEKKTLIVLNEQKINEICLSISKKRNDNNFYSKYK